MSGIQKTEELALLLLYLTSWDIDPKKKLHEEPILRSWKNIRFEILEKLCERGLIFDRKGSKSVDFSQEGVKKAEELKKKYFGG